MGSAETPATTQRIDPAADLQEATERNPQEKRNEEEALRLEKAEADRAEASAKKKLAEAEAAARRSSRLRKPHAASRPCSSPL